jgi:ABC-type multidrug transport system fused ATPase/permease subunit
MEAHESTEGLLPEKGWPHRGRVSFKDVSIRYAKDLPEVLSKVSFDVEVSACAVDIAFPPDSDHKPGMRVGLVGSTGSGKSTLALALFRAMSPHHGSIEIDGIGA